MMAEQGKGPVDTSHLYEGKVVRSSAPSRKKAAGEMKRDTGIPDDAVPEVAIPNWIDAIFGGPILVNREFVPPNKMVITLQMGAIGSLLVLGFLTFVLTPVSGTVWFTATNEIGLGILGLGLHWLLIISGLVCGLWGTWQTDQRFILVSYVALILVTVRFAGSKVEFGLGGLGFLENEVIQKFLLIFYAVFLVVYMEISSGVIRFSMLDTSIRRGEVYVMNVKSISDRYRRALGYTPAVAAIVATLTLFINFIVPLFIGVLDPVAANRLEESVELTSVYGVALGTILVFLIIASMFAINLPLRFQQYLENRS